jgi:hypothetical protein
VSFVSFTVPQYQRAESYFAPLAGLDTGPDTELNFGIVPYHPGDQAPGTTGDQARLIDAALADSPGGTREWGICTECGMGRAAREEIPVLLDLHRQIVAARSLARGVPGSTQRPGPQSRGWTGVRWPLVVGVPVPVCGRLSVGGTLNGTGRASRTRSRSGG